MLKKSLVFLLVLSLAVSIFLVGCAPKEEEVDTPPTTDVEDTTPVDETEEPAGPPAEPMGQIIIGDTTELSGDWLPYWTNIAADYNVYNFVMGYGTVDMTFEGEYVINDTVVKEYDVTENDDGSKTYTFTINDGLVYSDGDPITAKDYVTALLLWSSPQVQATGATATYGFDLVGYNEFNSGESKVFSGVRLLDEMTFSVTINPEKLPYFYELTMASVAPHKLSYWSDETVDILDDGEGCYFTDNFTTENFKDRWEVARYGTTEWPATGPYKIVSYDESAKTAVLEVNDKFIGDHTGQTAKIQTIIYKKVTNETALDELATGGVDLLNGMASGDEINQGLDLVDQGGFAYTEYPRSGYGKLAFQCDFGPTQFAEVRQAIAHLLDRADFARAFTGGFGSVVNGPYGESMWFYQETRSELNNRVNQYPYGLEAAVELLEKAGFIYDENGNPYTEGIRHRKMEDGTLMPLIIEWASSEANAVSDLLVVKLQENPDVAAAGMQINQTVMTFGDLINYLYRDDTQDPKYGVPTYGMFNLASNFTPVYDLRNTYTTDPARIAAGYNTNFLIDEELESLAVGMVLTDPEDRDGFKAKFVDFIARWNTLLPDIPLYSNIYHDFYNEKLENYNMNSLVRISQALLYAYVTE